MNSMFSRTLDSVVEHRTAPFVCLLLIVGVPLVVLTVGIDADVTSAGVHLSNRNSPVLAIGPISMVAGGLIFHKWVKA